MLHLGPYTETLAGETWDALICDPPYSERTHTGHNDGAATADKMRDQLARMEARVAAGLPVSRKDTTTLSDAGRIASMRSSVRKATRDSEKNRRAIEYKPWNADDVTRFVEWAHSRTRGWMVAMCDNVLAPAYIAAMEAQGRYAFAPIPWYSPGSRVRMTGDGPACWVVWLIISRPKGAPYSTWGSLPGGYSFAQDHGRTGNASYIGGKPLDLMRAIVRDYSRPGDTVCDPCAGWGTTLVASQWEGRQWVGSEMDPHAHAVATKRLENNRSAARLHADREAERRAIAARMSASIAAGRAEFSPEPPCEQIDFLKVGDPAQTGIFDEETR